MNVRRHLILVLFGLVIAGPVTTWAAAYNGRKQLRATQVAGCERGQKDRRANAQGWRIAEQARAAAALDPSTSVLSRRDNRRTAAAYDRIATGLEHRAAIPCGVAYPPVKLLPF